MQATTVLTVTSGRDFLKDHHFKTHIYIRCVKKWILELIKYSNYYLSQNHVCWTVGWELHVHCLKYHSVLGWYCFCLTDAERLICSGRICIKQNRIHTCLNESKFNLCSFCAVRKSSVSEIKVEWIWMSINH